MLRRAVPLCQMQQTESNLLETTCLKNQKRPLSKLFLLFFKKCLYFLCIWNTEHINIVAVMQKFFDQAIWKLVIIGALPTLKCLLCNGARSFTTYKLVGRHYYQNTHDMKTDEVEAHLWVGCLEDSNLKMMSRKC